MLMKQNVNSDVTKDSPTEESLGLPLSSPMHYQKSQIKINMVATTGMIPVV